MKHRIPSRSGEFRTPHGLATFSLLFFVGVALLGAFSNQPPIALEFAQQFGFRGSGLAFRVVRYRCVFRDGYRLVERTYAVLRAHDLSRCCGRRRRFLRGHLAFLCRCGEGRETEDDDGGVGCEVSHACGGLVSRLSAGT